MFPSIQEYEKFIYSLSNTYSGIQFSTLILHMCSKTVAQLRGEIYFVGDIRLRVIETIDFTNGLIEDYSYEVYQGEEKLYWYDSWPHPYISSLASTHPHHKHIPPNIKYNRIPAPNINFIQNNLLFLIKEIEMTLIG